MAVESGSSYESTMRGRCLLLPAQCQEPIGVAPKVRVVHGLNLVAGCLRPGRRRTVRSRDRANRIAVATQLCGIQAHLPRVVGPERSHGERGRHRLLRLDASADEVGDERKGVAWRDPSHLGHGPLDPPRHGRAAA
jgi:hypothetical protein